MLLGEQSPAQLKTFSEASAPRSLASATIATLAELPHDARHLAAAMAIVNQPMALAQIGRIAGIQAPLEPLDRLLATGLVSWSPDGPGQFRFPLPTHSFASLVPVISRPPSGGTCMLQQRPFCHLLPRFPIVWQQQMGRTMSWLMNLTML